MQSHVTLQNASRSRKRARHSAAMRTSTVVPVTPLPFAVGDVMRKFSMKDTTLYAVLKEVRRPTPNVAILTMVNVYDRHKEEGTAMCITCHAKLKVRDNVWDCAWEADAMTNRMYRALRDVEMFMGGHNLLDIERYVNARVEDYAERRRRFMDMMAVTEYVGPRMARTTSRVESVLTGQALHLKSEASDAVANYARQVTTLEDFDLVRRWNCYTRGQGRDLSKTDVDDFLGWFYMSISTPIHLDRHHSPRDALAYRR